MRRTTLSMLLISGGLLAQQAPVNPPPPSTDKQPSASPQQKKPQQEEEAPPEEDESLKPKEFSFNPLEAEHDVRIGNYYFKRKNYPAAMSRYQEATKWNPGMSEAYLHIGETAEKMKDKKAAREAYGKYIELAPDGKEAERLKKKLGGS